MTTAATTAPPARRAGAPLTTLLLARREVRTVLRTPEALVPALVIPVFVYFVMVATFDGFAAEFGIEAWQAFMVPVGLLFAVGNGSAGQNLVADIASGYFDKLLTTPASRLALLVGAMSGDFARMLAQATLVLLVGVVTGASVATGFAGALGMLAIAALWGLAYSAIGFAIALKTGSPQATGSAFLLFFPFTFLSPAFAPREAMADWLATAVAFNPLTYVLEAMRALAVTGWDAGTVGAGLLAIAGLGTVTLSACVLALRARVR